MKEEGKLEYNQLPAVEVGGKFYVQTRAILLMAGKKYGYYPEDDPEKTYLIDSFLDSLADVIGAFASIVMETD